MNPSPKIYLLPVALGDNAFESVPDYVKKACMQLNHFVVEDERTARRYLRASGFTKSFDEVSLTVLNEHTPKEAVSALLQPCRDGHDIGIMSEAGCPGVADPGAQLVRLAHKEGFKVVPMVGPSSILLALMASGMNGQQFAFHGYLPVDQPLQKKKIKEMEQMVLRSGQTQIFMETPYRNMRLFQSVMETCLPDTQFCVACDLTLPGEYIHSASVKSWKHEKPELHKRPAIFLLGR